MSVAEKIRTHGYWRVVIRPKLFVPDRIESISDLFPLVQRSSIQIRGWDFPHIDQRHPPKIGENWVQQDIEWEHHLERWRIFQNGQFAYLKAFNLDWAEDTANWSPRPPKPPRDALIGIGDTIYRFTEIFEFASAISLTAAGDEQMFVQVGCHGIEGRELWVDGHGRMPLFPARRTDLRQYVKESSFDRSYLVAESRQIGLKWARELFRRFDWDPSLDLLEGVIPEIRRR
ncbi:MAG TPA: hypothetical protein VN634_14950 [Candidatus Limnocylindrales bacterium]|nr:hypothetical protein [Candidatus Limnocylindrales bacterium]